MNRPGAMVRLAAAAAVVTATALSISVAAEAGSGPAASPGNASTKPVDRFNVANTHSPQLEHELATARAHPPGSLLPAAAAPATPAPAVQGIDVASVQHPLGAAINWTQVAAAGYKFVFIKSTEGSYYPNPYYAADASAAAAAGLIVAPYHFAIPNYSGGAFQADYALDHSGYVADGHTLPLIVDLENDPYAGLPPPKGDGPQRRGLRGSLISPPRRTAGPASLRLSTPPLRGGRRALATAARSLRIHCGSPA